MDEHRQHVEPTMFVSNMRFHGGRSTACWLRAGGTSKEIRYFRKRKVEPARSVRLQQALVLYTQANARGTSMLSIIGRLAVPSLPKTIR
jgi:hypothetical protein